MKTYRFVIIVENQKSVIRVNTLAKSISEELNFDKQFLIHEYYKINNSFKIEFFGKIINTENVIAQSVKLTNKT